VILFFWPILASSLHEGSVVNAFRHWFPLWLECFDRPLGQGSRGCRVPQLRLRHLTCGRAGDWSHTIMPHARGVAPVRRDPPETRRSNSSTNEEDGRGPRIAVGVTRPTAIPLRLCRDCGKRADLDAGGHDRSFDITPKCNQQLAGRRHYILSAGCARPVCRHARGTTLPDRCPVGSEATARLAGSSSSGHADCRLGRCVDHGRCCRSDRASV
jgi:hypothetical protein